MLHFFTVFPWNKPHAKHTTLLNTKAMTFCSLPLPKESNNLKHLADNWWGCKVNACELKKRESRHGTNFAEFTNRDRDLSMKTIYTYDLHASHCWSQLIADEAFPNFHALVNTKSLGMSILMKTQFHFSQWNFALSYQGILLVQSTLWLTRIIQLFTCVRK